MHFSAFGIQAHSPINFVLDLNFREPILANESTWTLESVGKIRQRMKKYFQENMCKVFFKDVNDSLYQK